MKLNTLISLIAVLLIVSSCGLFRKAVPPAETKVPTKQETLVEAAKSKLGCKYKYAGKGPDVFDCSGFTGYVYKQIGITIGASSREQFTQGRTLGKGEALQPGDLVFFNGSKIGSGVGHVGMVVDYNSATGEFTFIHVAVSTGVEIQKSTMDYYARRYLGARRIL